MENNILVKGKYDENECETQNLWKLRKSKKNLKKNVRVCKEYSRLRGKSKRRLCLEKKRWERDRIKVTGRDYEK